MESDGECGWSLMESVGGVESDEKTIIDETVHLWGNDSISLRKCVVSLTHRTFACTRQTLGSLHIYMHLIS